MVSGIKRSLRAVTTAVLLIAVVIGVVFAYMHRQQINDHFAAQRFQPTASVSKLTKELHLTDDGHRIFWASEPTLDASQNFNKQCSKVDHSEDGHILGCYSNSKIHLFEVTDKRLNGIVEVTAAHEMLHAAFARLDESEKKTLVRKLTKLYAQLEETHPEVKQRMSVYASLSKTAFANELHSVLATEVRDLPSWLEKHYATWLEDRTAILNCFDGYHAVFNELKNRADQLESEMSTLRADIERRKANYDAAVAQFNTEWQSFLARNDAFEFSSDPDEFYRLRSEFYERRDALGSEMRQLNSDIERYEELRKEIMALSELNHELEQQMDSDLAPPAPAPTGEVSA